ncbi:unnamed protein product [Aphanomyces euteiches]
MQEGPMESERRELEATKAALQQCREQLQSAREEIDEKVEFVDVLSSYINEVVEGQLKPQLEEAEVTTRELRGQVAALKSELTCVKSQLSVKTQDVQRLDEQVAVLASELQAAKAEAMAKDTATTALEDQVAAMKIACMHEKSRATADDSKMNWMCVASLMVVHAWSLLVVVVSWTSWLAMSACWAVKTWWTTVNFDENDQDMESNRWFDRRVKVSLVVMSVVVLAFVGATALQADTLTHDVHNWTSRPLPWTPSCQDKAPMVVDGVPVPLFADMNALSPVNDDMPDEEARRPEFIDGDANEWVSRLGSIVATACGVATTTAGYVLKVWVGWGVVSSLVQLYAGSRSP